MKPLGIDAAIDQIETALFDLSEPGCTDTEYSDEIVINSIGRIRLRAILKRLRVGYMRGVGINSLCPHDLAVQAKLKKLKKKR
jgi:hypothetical protein